LSWDREGLRKYTISMKFIVDSTLLKIILSRDLASTLKEDAFSTMKAKACYIAMMRELIGVEVPEASGDNESTQSLEAAQTSAEQSRAIAVTPPVAASRKKRRCENWTEEQIEAFQDVLRSTAYKTYGIETMRSIKSQNNAALMSFTAEQLVDKYKNMTKPAKS
jgi:hypothetical protein